MEKISAHSHEASSWLEISIKFPLTFFRWRALSGRADSRLSWEWLCFSCSTQLSIKPTVKMKKNKTKHDNNKKTSHLSCGWSDTLLREIPLAAWAWAMGLQASNVIRALAVNFFKGSWKGIFSKLWCGGKTAISLKMISNKEQMEAI